MANPTAANQSIAETYERNEVNDLFLGPTFEANVAIYTMLTLRNDGQAVAFECKTAPAKFDDVVLRDRNEENYKHYYCQLKHRDTEKDPDAYLTWNELLTGKKSKFGIPFYYDCLAQPRLDALSNVNGLVFVTNFNLAKQGTGGTLNNLEDLAKTLVNQAVTNKTPKIYITEDDLTNYFQECNTEDDKSIWTPPTKNQKSYKFTDAAVKAIFKGTRAGFRGSAPFDVSAYGKFLELFVFRVSMPHVHELKETNRQLLKLFLPFYKNMLSDDHIKIEFMQLFEPLNKGAGTVNASGKNLSTATATAQQCTAAWATIERCKSVFEKLTESFKKAVSIGSKVKYEIDVLTPTYKKLYPDRCISCGTSPWNSFFNDEISAAMLTKSKSNHFPVLNIYNDDSNATVLALNIFSHIKNCLEEHAWRTLVLEVREKTNITSVVECFKNLEEEVSHPSALIGMSFCCVIEVSPFFHPADKAVELAEKMTNQLIELAEIRKWVQFAVITQTAIFPEEECDGLKPIQGTPLNWGNLSEEGKKYLLNKKLYLENDKQITSLTKLGFKEDTVSDWLQPNSLAELIIHDEERPLSLGLPVKDRDLETDYVEREIQLPFVKTDVMGKILRQSSCKQENFNEASYLLIDSERRNIFLPVASKTNSWDVLEIEDCVTRSKDSDVTVHETDLLNDNVNFGTGAKDNKLLVVVDYPGKGKTWLLNSLSNRFHDSWSKTSSHYLLLRVNLRDVTDWKEYSAPLEFFVRHSLDSRRDSAANHLNRAIVKEKCLNGPEPSVFVFLDGYDEISDEQRSITLDVATYLKNEAKGVKRIILTSRPEGKLENELETRFSQFSLHIKNFDEQTQIDYLTKRWTAKLTRRKKLNGANQKVEFFARELVNFASCHLTDEYSTFLDIPLQCWIFSECFFKELEQYLELASTDGETKPTFDEASFELLNLYNHFYNVKVDVLLQEKAGLPDKNDLFCYVKEELTKIFLNTMMRLSTIHLMRDTDDAQAISCLSLDVYRSEIRDCDNVRNEMNYGNDLMRAIKLGFVKSSVNDTLLSSLEPEGVKFLHRTFAEYFFARYLFQNFIQEKSELLDDVCEAGQGILSKRFEKISEKIFAADEYAGVRRFLDRMLEKHLPPASEQCPFATESRSNVLKRWPVLGHETFNKRLAEFAISLVASVFKKWPRDEQGTGKLEKYSDHLIDDIATLLHREKEPEVMRFAMFLDVSGSMPPSITLLLLHCIKEYACRADTSEAEREDLARFFTSTSYSRIRQNDGQGNKDIMTRHFSSLLHTLDRVPGLTAEANNIFSKWFFILFVAIGEEDGLMIHDCKQAALCAGFEMFKSHSDAVKFDENVRSLVSLFVFGNCNSAHKVGLLLNDLLKAQDSEDCMKSYKRILNSLSAIDFLGDFLARNLADWFVAKLSERSERIDEQYDERYRTITHRREEYFERGRWRELMDPYYVGEAVKFLRENASKLPDIVTVDTVLNDTLLKCISKSRTLLYADNHLTDIQIFGKLKARRLKRNNKSNGFLKKGAPERLANNKAYQRYEMILDKTKFLDLTFWNHLLTDEIISFLPDKQARRNIMQEAFLNELGRQCLIAFTHAGCCCQCKCEFYTGFGIHFPYRTFYLEETARKTFSDWFANGLDFVWEEKGEIYLIDFLFKGVRSTQLSQENAHSLTEICDAIHNSKNPAKSDDGLFLTAIDFAKLPCLLFSDLVSEFFLTRLSSDGWRHLEQTLDNVPLITCRNGCFNEKKKTNLPRVKINKTSLWGGIMQEDPDNVKIFSCNKLKSERITALREKFKEFDC